MKTTSLVLAMMLATTVAVSQDRVDRLRGGSVAGGSVTSEDWKQVVFQKEGGGPVRIPAVLVVDVVRGDAPKSYREGRDALRSGDPKGASNLFRAALAEKDAKPWVKEHAGFYLGEALREAGLFDEAAKAYDSVIQARQDSRFVPRAKLGRGAALIAMGKGAEASAELKAFAADVDAKGLSLLWRIRALSMAARSLLSQKKYDEAALEFDASASALRPLVGKAAEDERRDLEVALLRLDRDRGLAQVRAKKLPDAERTFAAIESAAKDDPIALGIARLGLAEVRLAGGKPDDARLLAARAYCLNFSADEEMPWITLVLAKSYAALAEKGEKGASKAARGFLEDLVQQFPNSEAALEGKAFLAALK